MKTKHGTVSKDSIMRINALEYGKSINAYMKKPDMILDRTKPTKMLPASIYPYN